MADNRVTVRGGRETAAALRALGTSAAQRQVLIKSLRPAASQIRTQARSNLQSSGYRVPELLRAISVQVRRDKKKADATIRIGHQRGRDGKLWGFSWIFDRGTGERVQVQTGRRTGRITATRYFTRAFETVAPQVVRIFGDQFRPELKRMIAKNAVRKAVYARRGRR